VRGDSPQQCFSNLILIFETADRWKMPATALAQCVSMVHGKQMYEGKVITAMLESTLGTRLQYHWTGQRGTPGYRIFVWDKSFDPKDGHITQEQLDALAPDNYPPGARMIDGSVGDWQTFQKNSTTPNPAWTGAASRNQLAYRGSREWARLYEPGKMLGVYGDDEVQAWEDREARTLPAPGAAITTGFTRPAADAPADAEFEPVKGTPLEASQAATGASGSDTPAEGGAPAQDATPPAQQASEPKPPRKSAADKAAEARAAQEKETQLRLERCELVQTQGFAAGREGNALTLRAGLTEEEAGYYRNGHAEGFAIWMAEQPNEEAQVEPIDAGDRRGLALEAFEAGHEAGLKGEPGDTPRAWTEFADDYAEGWNAGAAERLQDAAEGDEGEGDEEMDDFVGDQELERTPFEVFQEGVREHPTWGEVKAALNTLSRSEAWKSATSEPGGYLVRGARVSAGLRLGELQAAGKEPLDVQATDLTAFRCWMETVEDPDLVLAKWQELVQSPAVGALSSDQRAKMEGAVKGRMAELQQGKGDPSI
jgi:hypothetical protein